MKKFLIGLGAMSLVAGQSVAASAAPAIERADAPVASAEAFAGDDDGRTYLFLVLLGAIVVGTIIAMDGDDDDNFDPEPFPVSP